MQWLSGLIKDYLWVAVHMIPDREWHRLDVNLRTGALMALAPKSATGLRSIYTVYVRRDGSLDVFRTLYTAR